MQFPVKTGAPGSTRTACAILPLFDSERLAGAAKALDRASSGAIRKLVRSGDAPSKLGRSVLLRDVAGPAAKLLLVGCGPRAQFGPKQFGVAAGAAAQALADSATAEAVSYLGSDLGREIEAYAAARITTEAFRATLYRFNELKSKAEPAPALRRVGIAVNSPADARAARHGVVHGQAIANGVDLARNLGNRPPNVCTPTHLADAAKDIAKRFKNMHVKVLGATQMKALGMGALLSVAQGATEPPRFIVLNYRGGDRSEAPIALCGKGITFDTGGISLKPPPKMDEMKFDMCGAAAVLGTMQSLGELGAECNVVGIVPTCENMPGGSATRPGDIVTSLSGQTIEILNTDAEGRLILCDALAYAQTEFKPRCILDVATLTGACVIALGPLYTAVFSKDDELAAALIAAGQRALDGAWRLPLDDEYGESLRSNFADFANAGTREGGASVAAQFLSRFVGSTPWAHLDIAGVAWRGSANKGATGRPVPLLVDFLLNA